MDKKRLTKALVLGLCFSVAFGFALDNIAIGIGLGILFGITLSQVNGPKKPPSQ